MQLRLNNRIYTIKFRSQSTILESVSVSANPTPQGKLLSSRRMLHVQGTLIQIQWYSLGKQQLPIMILLPMMAKKLTPWQLP